MRRILCQLFIIALSCRVVGEPSAGLVATYGSGGVSDRNRSVNVQLFVPAGEPVTPFVPAGKFSVTWNGFIASELRANYTFHVIVRGRVQLTVGGTMVLNAEETEEKSVATGKLVRLSKGANAVTIRYTSPDSGDASIRLYWSNEDTPFNPVPNAALTAETTKELAKSLEIHAGRDLVLEHRCVRCHSLPGTLVEFAMDAPSFQDIGSRRREGWMADWIENPRVLRLGTPMPIVFSEKDAAAKTKRIAAYLASLKGGTQRTRSPGNVVVGKALFETLHCAACHNPPGSTEENGGKISLNRVGTKFKPDALIPFLLRPEEHYAWNGMPNFNLSSEEAANLAAHLLTSAEKPNRAELPSTAAEIEQGKRLVATSGCLNCHELVGMKNEFTTRSLREVSGGTLKTGCLAEKQLPETRAPRFGFSSEQLGAVRAFLGGDRNALLRETAADFLERQSVHLRCRECHGTFEGFPAWELIGGKLKPEYAAAMVGGAVVRKPRPWLDARMPAFPAYAPLLAVGLATAYGLPPKSAADPVSEGNLAVIGRKLVSANGGFSCVSCHGAGDFAATQVFEAPGINLAQSFVRLQPDYFSRWVRSPTSIDPSTKMPVYFDEEGKSPLTEVLEGDGPKTLRAIWEYLRAGEQIAKPE